jgi:hypothetical protein
MDLTTFLAFGVPVLLLVIEWRLGETDDPKANSILSLLASMLRGLSGKK